MSTTKFAFSLQKPYSREWVAVLSDGFRKRSLPLLISLRTTLAYAVGGALIAVGDQYHQMFLVGGTRRISLAVYAPREAGLDPHSLV